MNRLCTEHFERTLELAKTEIRELSDMHLTSLTGFVNGLYLGMVIGGEEYETLIKRINEIKILKGIVFLSDAEQKFI